MRRQILLIAALFLFAVGTAGFQQVATDGSQQPYNEKQARMLGLMRTINTLEVVADFGHYGSYTPWLVLMESHSDELSGWLARNWPEETSRQEAPLRFADQPEVLPGMRLRLNLNADGRGYSVLIEDIQDKHGFAFVSDERGIIREGKYIR